MVERDNNRLSRIMFVVPYLSGGGAERVVATWSKELDKIGYDVHILVFYRTGEEYRTYGNVKIHTIANSKEHYKKMKNTEKLLAIRKNIKEYKPKLVIPFVTYVGIMCTISSVGLKIKLVETIRNNPWLVPNKKYGRFVRNLSVILSNHCIVQNSEQINYFPKYLRKKMVIIPNSISEEFFQSEKIYKEKKISKIISVGRLEKQKNHSLLITAFSKIAGFHPYITLEIYGDGPLREQLQTMINRLNMNERIYLRNRSDEIINKLRDSDLFVLSSNYEGMPNALMEAMALGVPCIATNCPTGPSDLIVDELDGKLVPVCDEAELINAMSYLIKNPDKAIEMGKRSRLKMIEKYNNDANISHLKSWLGNI